MSKNWFLHIKSGVAFQICIVVALMAGALSSCQREFLPKPLGYNRLILPDPEYQSLTDTFPYRFDYSRHARLLPDTSRMRERFWIEIFYPELNATIHITYKAIKNNEQLLKEFMNDAYTLAAKHQIKAYAIDEAIITTPKGKTAVVVELQGEVPSQMQFTITDSTKNFLRGALYFNTKVQNDSLKPAIEYMKKDVMQLINSFDWNKQ
jgi:gliding motility-associated lipoprotein GldD